MPAVDDKYLDEVRARPESEHGMSNFDHSVDEGLEADLRAGMRGVHAAWNFNGMLWYDEAEGRFYEAVSRYHLLAGVVGAADLPDLMREVNDIYGSD